jgi:hypothetical protein
LPQHKSAAAQLSAERLVADLDIAEGAVPCNSQHKK